jgi:hypothetical protein
MIWQLALVVIVFCIVFIEAVRIGMRVADGWDRVDSE